MKGYLFFKKPFEYSLGGVWDGMGWESRARGGVGTKRDDGGDMDKGGGFCAGMGIMCVWFCVLRCYIPTLTTLIDGLVIYLLAYLLIWG